MAYEGNFPWELTEGIFSRVPPKSLSKQWNALLNDKSFIKNHKSTFRFILRTNSNTYSVSIDPEIVVRELALDIPLLECQQSDIMVDCDGFLLCSMNKGVALWNPWLNQTRCIKGDLSQRKLRIDGIGYDNKRIGERVYKTIAYDWNHPNYNTWWKVHDIASDAWKIHDIASDDDTGEQFGPEEEDETLFTTRFGVSLKGNLYWVSFQENKDPINYHVVIFDFSTERFDIFCDLPCAMNHPLDTLALGVFKGDRFSLLKQCHLTKKIEIWVTKNKINGEDGKDVVWMSLMTWSIPNFPSLVQNEFQTQPSYFIEDKRLVLCFCDETGFAWVYVLGDNNKLISKTRVDNVVDPWPFHCTYFSSLVSVPRSQREEAGL